MNKKDYIKLLLGLCGSNTAMMAAWYILLPIKLPIVVAILLSWSMAAFLEYPLHVWANGVTHGTLGRITQRFINEVPNFAAFLLISVIAGEHLHWKYFIGLALVAIVVFLFGVLSKRTVFWNVARVVTAVVVICWGIVSVVWLPIHDTTHKLIATPTTINSLSHIIAWRLPGGLPLVWLFGCFAANTLQLFAWYTHPKIERPPRWFTLSPQRRFLFAWLVSIGLAFLEYCVLIPVNRGSYNYISIIQLFGYMEITLVSVFILGNIAARFLLNEPFKLTKRDIAGFLLLISIEAATCIF